MCLQRYKKEMNNNSDIQKMETKGNLPAQEGASLASIRIRIAQYLHMKKESSGSDS